MLAHAEVYSFTFNKTGEYKYMCTPHPYMKAEIMVVDADEGPMIDSSFNYVIIILAIILLALIGIMIITIFKLI